MKRGPRTRRLWVGNAVTIIPIILPGSRASQVTGEREERRGEEYIYIYLSIYIYIYIYGKIQDTHNKTQATPPHTMNPTLSQAVRTIIRQHVVPVPVLRDMVRGHRGNHTDSVLKDTALFLESSLEYKRLLSLYTPLSGMTPGEKVARAAKHVGLKVPGV